MRAMQRLGLLLMIAGVVAVALAGTALAGGGNSENAKLCQQDGWQQLVRNDGTSFKNTGDCVSYAARGGTFGVGCRIYGGGFDFLQTAAMNTSPNGNFYNSNNGSCSGAPLVEGTLVQAATVGAANTICNAILGPRG